MPTRKHKHCCLSDASLSSSALERFNTEYLNYNEELAKQFSRNVVSRLYRSRFNPEPFLKPASHPNQHILEREVNAHKIYQYLLNYMDEYYDISQDAHPFSKWRERIDERLWDSLSYVIPLLCRQVIRDAFIHEDTIITVGPDVIVFGDIHGNLNDIYYIHKNYINDKKYANFKFIFLGDYVDRGPKSLEVLLFLFSIKMINPKRYILLRGNHEVSKVNKKYGFQAMIYHLYTDIDRENGPMLHSIIYQSFNQAFNHLPLGAVIRFKNVNKKGIFCCHGGIPNESYNKGHPWTIEQLTRLSNTYKPHDLVPRKRCSAEQSVLSELLWNDPVSESFMRHAGSQQHNMKLFYCNTKRGGHCSKFSEMAVDRFLAANNLRMVIRGHQFRCCKEKGYHFQFTDKTLTVFSSSNYCGVEHNTTGCVMITNDYCQPMILRSIEESQQYQQFNLLQLITDKHKKVIDVIF